MARRYSAALAGTALLLLSGCSGTGVSSTSHGAAPAGPASPPSPVSLRLNPAQEESGVSPGTPVSVRAEGGSLATVSLTSITSGKTISGTYDKDKRLWSSTGRLDYRSKYRLVATGVGDDKRRKTESSTFTTVTPDSEADAQLAVGDHRTVGVAMPIPIQFTEPVTNKKAAEKAVQVKTSNPTVGAWHWFGEDEMVWRPKEYWAPGTEVTVQANLYGVELADGVYGSGDETKKFTVGRRFEMTANGESHQMIVRINGKRKRTIPISMGQPGHETPEGRYTVMSESAPYTMDSGTYGVPANSPGGYRTTVDVAVRLSNSGIFYHSAPWSVSQQGYVNVSHGCINVSTSNAYWLMHHSNPGDPVTVVKSGGPKLDPTDGWGFWQMPWNKWAGGRR